MLNESGAKRLMVGIFGGSVVSLKECWEGPLEKALVSLDTRERRVMELRFGLVDGRRRTLEEVGKEFSVTRERIRQLEAKALRKLGQPSPSCSLIPFLCIPQDHSGAQLQ